MLEREVQAERWTRLDREIQLAVDKIGYIDLRPPTKASSDPEIRRLMVGRLQLLKKMGAPSLTRPGERMVGLEADQSITQPRYAGDIIKTMHRAFAERREARGVVDFIIEG